MMQNDAVESLRTLQYNNTMKKYSSTIAVIGLVAGLALTTPAFAQTNPGSAVRRGAMWANKEQGEMHRRIPGIFGTVSSMNGTTLTVAGKLGPKDGSASTTYTVDATNATVWKNGATSTIASIAVNDTIMVRGTVNGSNVAATEIHDGFQRNGQRGPEANPIIKGNGEPVLGGTVSAVNGSSLTITNKSNVTYSVDATSASIIKMGTSTTISSVAIGDTLVVQGTVNGNSVTASSIIDQANAPANGGVANAPKPHLGFFGSIGAFFGHLFGF